MRFKRPPEVIKVHYKKVADVFIIIKQKKNLQFENAFEPKNSCHNKNNNNFMNQII